MEVIRSWNIQFKLTALRLEHQLLLSEITRVATLTKPRSIARFSIFETCDKSC